MKILKVMFEFLWKGVIIGVLNLIALMISAGLLTSLGGKFPKVESDMSYIIFSMFLSGFFISIIYGIIIKCMRIKKLRVFFTIYLMLLLNVVAQILEALFFTPGIVSWEAAQTLMGQQLIMYMIVSIGIVLLFKSESQENESTRIQKRSFLGWIWRILLSAGSYVIYYYVFGFINAKLFTMDFYINQINGLRLPSTLEILILEPIRALIMVVSVIPAIIYLRVSTVKRMILVGTFLFVFGGLLPMIQQIGTLPTILVVSTIIELFFQNFLLGVTTTLIILYEKRSFKGLIYPITSGIRQDAD